MYGSSAISLVITLLLARILLPRDFGLIAAVVIFTGFVEVIIDTAIGSSIVQRRDLTDGELSSLFWLVLTASILVYCTLVGSGSLLGRLFEQPLIPSILPIAGVNTIFFGLLCVPLALVRQRLQFKHLAILQTISTAISGSTALFLAIRGFGYHALIVQTLLFVAIRTTGTWIVARWRPLLRFRAAEVRQAMSYSGPLIASSVVNYWARHVDAILIARTAGITSLGHYNLAQRLVYAPLTVLTAGVRAQLHPLFSAMGHDREKVRAGFRDAMAMTAILSFPIGALLFVVSEPLVLALWGPQWAPTSSIVQALALLAGFQPITALTASLYLTRSETGLYFRITLVNSIALVTAMALGAHLNGAEGVAWAYSATVVLVIVPQGLLNAYVRLFEGRVRDILRSLVLPSLAAGGVLVAGGTADLILAGNGAAPIIRVAGTLLLSGVSLLAVARLFAWPLVLRTLAYLRTMRTDTTGRPDDLS